MSLLTTKFNDTLRSIISKEESRRGCLPDHYLLDTSSLAVYWAKSSVICRKAKPEPTKLILPKDGICSSTKCVNAKRKSKLGSTGQLSGEYLSDWPLLRAPLLPESGQLRRRKLRKRLSKFADTDPTKKVWS